MLLKLYNGRDFKSKLWSYSDRMGSLSSSEIFCIHVGIPSNMILGT